MARQQIRSQRIGFQLQQAALTVSAMPQKPRRQDATELRNAQLSVGSCKPLLDGGLAFDGRLFEK